jgi:hypothetical protein
MTLTINETNGQHLTYNNVGGSIAGDVVTTASDNSGGTLVYWTTTPSPNATWLSNPSTGDWNTGTNWSTGSIPSGTATFGPSTQTSINVPTYIGTGGNIVSVTGVAEIQFLSGAPAYTISIAVQTSLEITGLGIVDDSSFAPTFTGPGSLVFYNSASAADAIISVDNVNFTRLMWV